jgi:hypothetical protein
MEQDNLGMTQPEADLMEQLASYNKEDMKMFIDSMKQELHEQQQLNAVLHSENIQTDIEYLNAFLEENMEDMMNQVDDLKSVKADLEAVVKDNKEMKAKEEDLQSLMDSEECNRVAEKLRDLKGMKQALKSFLVQQGIVSDLS